jgi:hypothetical protein
MSSKFGHEAWTKTEIDRHDLRIIRSFVGGRHAIKPYPNQLHSQDMKETNYIYKHTRSHRNAYGLVKFDLGV